MKAANWKAKVFCFDPATVTSIAGYGVRLASALGLLLVLLAPLAAQEEPAAPDVLYLRNGSTLKGRLLYYIQGEQIVFELSTGDRVTFPERQIRRIVQGGIDPGPVRNRAPRPYAFREEGWYGMFNLGLAFGRTSGSEGTVAPGLQLAGGRQWSRWLGTGLGGGMDVYGGQWNEIAYPLFGEVRGYLGRRKKSFFYAMRAGYGFVFPDEERGQSAAAGGLFANPAIGIRWGASPGINITSEFGFQYQRASYTFGTESEEWREVRDMQYKRLTFRIGVLF